MICRWHNLATISFAILSDWLILQLDIHRQISKVSTRLGLVEAGAVVHTPEIIVSCILNLDAQRCWSPQELEPVTTPHQKYCLRRKLRHSINAGRGSTKV